MALAALTSVIWGLGFVAGKFGLESFTPAQLTAARFVIACLPVLLVPRPRISWSAIVLIGSTQFTGQFLFMFFAFNHGLPPGVASVSQQMPFAVLSPCAGLLASALIFGEVPSPLRYAGMALILDGLVVVLPARVYSAAAAAVDRARRSKP